MLHRSGTVVWILLAFALLELRTQGALGAGNRVSLDTNHVLVLNGKKVFPIGFTKAPAPGSKTPDGTDGMAELVAAGGLFTRTGSGGPWTAETVAEEQVWMDACARAGLFCWPYLGDLASLKPNDPREPLLRQVVTRFKDHPGLLVWKGVDEPEWGKHPVEPMLRAYRIIHELDPGRPIVTIQAPRGTVESLRPYNVASDILGMDIYPVSYPPGTHSLLTNKTLSLVGDHTRIIKQAADGKLPVWMVLQIAWSGVTKPGKTLRFPTFPELRFMSYQAIVNGARGLIYFGGNNPIALSSQDAALGWNWTFWRRVLRPMVEEIGLHSPLAPALVAPESPLPIQVAGNPPDVEFCVREVDSQLFILACKVGGDTRKVRFTGLPTTAGTGHMLYEEPRKVIASKGWFEDWFAPYEVHVYRFALSP